MKITIFVCPVCQKVLKMGGWQPLTEDNLNQLKDNSDKWRIKSFLCDVCRKEEDNG